MKKRFLVLLLLSHIGIGAVGFGAGIYVLPILIAPPAPELSAVESVAGEASFQASFVKDLPGSDAFHWGEGEVYIGQKQVSFKGELAPGPDYKLYFSPDFVDDEASFNAIKDTMRRVGDVKTFNNFVVDLPSDTDLERFNTVVVWCETFGEFITAAKYR